MRSLLRNNQPLQRFFLGQLIQRTSDWIDIIVLNWAILQITHDPMALALLNMMRLLPQLIFAFITGKVVDCMQAIKLMYTVHACNILLTVILCFSFYERQLYMIYAVIAVRAYVQSIDNIQRNKVLPNFTAADKLKQIISMNALLINITRIIGPFIGGILLAYTTYELLLLIPVLSSVCVILLNKTLPHQNVQYKEHNIVQYFKTHKVILHIMITSMISMFFGFSFTIVLPIIVKQTLNQGALMYAVYTAVLALGSVTVLMCFMDQHKQTTICALNQWSVLFSLSIVMMLVQHTYIFMIAIFIMGFASQGFRTTHRVLVQQYTEEQYKGTVLSVTMMDRGFIPLGGMMLTYLYTTFGINVMFTTMFIGLVCVTLLCIYMKWEEKRDGTYIQSVK
ncbi:MFS transporter [Macrococcus sp. S115]|uniref:MFS transporter n=1 Tax=Macrococcus sp. S115 TaxID=3047480 RepID=UPI0024BC32AF|nr:MFS transporter [Macrococcus sp. S115]MDJ1112436.1 MFS transporter [Macrococcus sp. S115]